MNENTKFSSYSGCYVYENSEVMCVSLLLLRLQRKSENIKNLMENEFQVRSVSEEFRPSQIACTVTTMHVRCMQTVLCVHKILCMVLIPLCDLNLPISHRPLGFKKIKTTTTTAFLISNTIVPHLYCHSTAFDPQSFAPLS